MNLRRVGQGMRDLQLVVLNVFVAFLEEECLFGHASKIVF